jgi:hypothetical protein
MSCPCSSQPCGCQDGTTPPDVVIVPSGSQIIQVPAPVCSPAASATPEPPEQPVCPDPLPALSSSFTAPNIGSQFRFSTPCANQFVRPGHLIWFPGFGYAEAVYVNGDAVTAKNISIPEGIKLEVDQEFHQTPPHDSTLLSVLCQARTGQAGGIIGCFSGNPGVATAFADTVFPIATQSDFDGGVTLLARNSTGELRRVPAQNGKSLQGVDGAWELVDAPSGAWDYVSGDNRIFSQNHGAQPYDQTAVVPLSGVAGYQSHHREALLFIWMRGTVNGLDYTAVVKVDGKVYAGIRITSAYQSQVDTAQVCVPMPPGGSITISVDLVSSSGTGGHIGSEIYVRIDGFR